MTGRAVPHGVVRTGISLRPEELAQLDRWVELRNSASRSEAIRFLIRRMEAETVLSDSTTEASGCLLVLYNHRAPNVQRRLTEAQHRWGDRLRSSMHVHLRDDACLEVMVLIGPRGEIERAAEDLRGVKGIQAGQYLLAPTRLSLGAGPARRRSPGAHDHRVAVSQGRAGRSRRSFGRVGRARHAASGEPGDFRAGAGSRAAATGGAHT